MVLVFFFLVRLRDAFRFSWIYYSVILYALSSFLTFLGDSMVLFSLDRQLHFTTKRMGQLTNAVFILLCLVRAHFLGIIHWSVPHLAGSRHSRCSSSRAKLPSTECHRYQLHSSLYRTRIPPDHQSPSRILRAMRFKASTAQRYYFFPIARAYRHSRWNALRTKPSLSIIYFQVMWQPWNKLVVPKSDKYIGRNYRTMKVLGKCGKGSLIRP